MDIKDMYEANIENYRNEDKVKQIKGKLIHYLMQVE